MKPQNPLAKGLHSMSLRASVDAHCYQCMGGAEEDLRTQISVVELIRGCDSKICPLHPVRPYKPPKTVGKADQ